jgi:hypothetical protein
MTCTEPLNGAFTAASMTCRAARRLPRHLQKRSRSPVTCTSRMTAGLCIGVMVLFVAGCTSSGPSGTTPSPASSRPGTDTSPMSASAAPDSTWPVVAVGDSVPAGSGCDCTPYPQLSASDLSVPGVRDVSADNYAVGGYTTQDVQLPYIAYVRVRVFWRSRS